MFGQEYPKDCDCLQKGNESSQKRQASISYIVDDALPNISSGAFVCARRILRVINGREARAPSASSTTTPVIKKVDSRRLLT